MRRLSLQDGTWDELIVQWKAACDQYGQDLNEYLPETMALLESECDKPQGHLPSGVYASMSDDGHYRAICFINCTRLPGYTGPVQRVRHILLSPHVDFGVFDEAQYGELLGTVFEDVVAASDPVFGCKHLKIHFRSPADVAIIKKVKTSLQNSDHFSSVELVGAWLFLTKC